MKLIENIPLTPCPSPVGRGALRKQKLPPGLLANARELRQRMTEPEELMWGLLRNRNFLGLKFRREHPVREGFILDFYCHEYRLDIEIDGGYHATKEQQEYDLAREQELYNLGINVIRFTNEEVLEQTEMVLQHIAETIFLISTSLPQSPSPVGREGRGMGNK